jgi:histone-lysine N-methyltransferase SETDB1
LAKIRVGGITTVEWNGVWWTARVKDMDCSIVKLQIIANHIVVSVWKGSPRLLSIFREYNERMYRRITLPGSTNEEYEGKIVKHEIPPQFLKRPVEYKPHSCNKDCLGSYSGRKSDLVKLGPLVVPFYHGWQRKMDPDDPRRRIYYLTPCGLKLYTLEDLQNFLSKLNSTIAIDCFCFDFAVECLDEFQVTKPAFFHCEDISYGKEWVPISKINTVDDVNPPYIAYTNERLYGKGVAVNISPDFLVCCDCVDDCTDKLKCACTRLTFENEPEFFADPENFSKGYQHRRLRDKYVFGIYECNQLCKCRSTCVNRVVQHGLRWKLQVFKTSSKGYAIRTLQDIPEGSFICVYTGELLSSKQANEFGGKFGDEYLANIDFIEFAEMHKEGYEEFVVEPEPEPVPARKAGRSKNASKEDKKRKGKGGKRAANSGKNEFISGAPQKANKRKRNISTESEEETSDTEEQSSSSKTRELFGPQEDSDIYTIDAKCIGNIGRYLNHSCDPNVFAQDVFLDTHDIRFPWVAFFASRYLKSGTELTWDYNYEIGMAEGKSVDCNCGSAYCRRRLL